MGKVEPLVSKVAPIDWDEEITSKSVLEYIGLAKATLSNMSEAQVSDIEKFWVWTYYLLRLKNL